MLIYRLYNNICYVSVLGLRESCIHGWKFSGLFLNSGFWGLLSIKSQPQNAELSRLNSFSDLFSVHLRAIDHLNLKLLIFWRHTASFKIWISKVLDFWNFELSPMCIVRIFYKRYSLFWTVNDNCLLCTCANLFTTLKVSMSNYRSSTIGELCNY